jgi:CRISPR-associated protein Csb1
VDGKDVECVLLDSNQSAANRCEAALQALVDEGSLDLPFLSMTIETKDRTFKVTSLTAPHRNYDSHFYQGSVGGVAFKNSELGKALSTSNVLDATMLFKHSPTTLIFGGWNSSSAKGGLFGTKIPRAIDSEIVAYNCAFEQKTANRLDPLIHKIGEKAGGNLVYAAKPELGILATTNKDEAEQVKGKAKEIKPSNVNLGSAVTLSHNGITMDYARETTVISLRRFREMKFPKHKEQEWLARTYLAALALASTVLRQETGGYTLRSGCELQPTEALVWEFIGRPGEEPKKYVVTAEDALKILRDVTAEVKKSDLPWEPAPVVVEPSKQHIELVQLTVNSVGTEDDSADDEG